MWFPIICLPCFLSGLYIKQWLARNTTLGFCWTMGPWTRVILFISGVSGESSTRRKALVLLALQHARRREEADGHDVDEHAGLLVDEPRVFARGGRQRGFGTNVTRLTVGRSVPRKLSQLVPAQLARDPDTFCEWESD